MLVLCHTCTVFKSRGVGFFLPLVLFEKEKQHEQLHESSTFVFVDGVIVTCSESGDI